MGVSAVVAAVAASAAVSYTNGQKQEKAAEAANRAATENAKQAKQQSEMAFNKANAKTPDLAAMLSANEQAAKGGVGGTMLTGAQGIDPATLQLGKNSLLGN